MSIRVEFYGIPRQRAGTSEATVQAASLGDALAALAARFPAFASACLERRSLRPGFVANLNGDRFLAGPDEPLRPGDTLLIFSADAGG